jgi:hypothetical protein
MPLFIREGGSEVRPANQQKGPSLLRKQASAQPALHRIRALARFNGIAATNPLYPQISSPGTYPWQPLLDLTTSLDTRLDI